MFIACACINPGIEFATLAWKETFTIIIITIIIIIIINFPQVFLIIKICSIASEMLKDYQESPVRHY